MMKRKVIALVLSAGMILGSAPVQTWAEESTETDSVVSFAEEAPIEETSIGEEVSDEDKVQTTEDTKSAFIYEETHEGTEVVSDADIDASYAESMPDNDELMQGYIEQLFSTDSISLMGMNEILVHLRLSHVQAKMFMETFILKTMRIIQLLWM